MREIAAGRPTNQSMKAIVYGVGGTLEWQDVSVPSLNAGEVLIKVATVGICGSELSALEEQTSYRVPPLIMGHEFSGIRVDTHERVTVNPLIACKKCKYCQQGRPQLCTNRTLIGVHRPGAFAEYVTAPEYNTIVLPGGMSAAQAALAEPMATVVHFMRELDFRQIKRLGIIGTGGIGMLTLLAARALGVQDVEVAELLPARRELALACGATAAVPKLDGEFGAIVDAVGISATRASSVDLLERGGRAIWVGLHSDECSLVNVRQLIRKECSITSSFAYSNDDFHTALRLLADLDIGGVVQEMPFTSGLSAFDQLVAGRVAAPKVHLVMEDRLTEQ
jgi:threonine dehydrogenase-like Zn-dependent dehydrogenase